MVHALSPTPSEYGASRADEEKQLHDIATTPQSADLFDCVDGYGRQSRGKKLRRPNHQWRRRHDPADAVKIAIREGHRPIGLRLPHLSLKIVAVAVAGACAATPALSFVIPSVTEAIARSAFGLIPNSVHRKVELNATCALMTPVFSEDGKLLTYFQKPGCENSTYVSAPVTEKGAMNVAPAFAAVEGAGFGHGVILNMSITGFMRAVANLGQIGGTNFVQSAIESAAGRPHGLGKLEKLWMVFGVGTSFTAENLRTDTAKAVFAVQNLQCAVGASGSSFGPAIAGEFCAAIVGRAHLEEVTVAEACVIASTFVSPLRVPAVEQDQKAYADQFEAIKKRARTRCAPKLVDGDTAGLEREINAVKLPSPTALFALSGRSDDALPFAGRLLEEFGVKQGGSRLVTTLNPRAQRVLVARAIALGNKLVGSFNPALCWAETCGSNRVDIAVGAFEVKQGVPQLLAGYESRRELLAGPRDGRPHRSVGSLSKTLVVPLFVDAGITRLCRAPWGELHDADGSAGRKCNTESDYVTVDSAIARSSNLAIADGLRRIDENVLRDHLAFAGYTIHGDLNHAQLVRSLITGDKVSIAPLPLIRDYAGLLFTPNGATRPTIVGEADMTTSVKFGVRFNPEVFRKTRSIMAAPLLEEHGTLLSARKALEAAGCKDIFGKSGTTDSNDRENFRDKLVMIGGRCSGRDMVAFALVGSPDINLPVGNISTNNVAALATDAITLALKKGDN